MSDAATVETLSFEEAMAELEGIVDKLEHGNVPLEQSIAFYERGEALKARCDALLKNAEMRVEKVRLKASGAPAGTEPLDPEAPGAAAPARAPAAAPAPAPRPAAPAPRPAAKTEPTPNFEDDIPF
jgi:exodeoxyribonuclease VII small subunit